MDREESNISHNIEDDILQVTVAGSVTVSDIVTYVQNHIEVLTHSPRVLWDFRQALFPYITSESLSDLSDRFSVIFRHRADWHTAVVVRGGDDLLGNFLVNLQEANSVPAEYQTFVNLHEARTWLQSIPLPATTVGAKSDSGAAET